MILQFLVAATSLPDEYKRAAELSMVWDLSDDGEALAFQTVAMLNVQLLAGEFSWVSCRRSYRMANWISSIVRRPQTWVVTASVFSHSTDRFLHPLVWASVPSHSPPLVSGG